MANAPEAHTVEALKPAPYNPRKIKPEALDNLGESMQEFGDLSGVVRNVRTDRLVGGHQRKKTFDPSWKIERNAVKDKTGTVAVGYIVTPWGLFNYREVDWDDAKEHAANISANKLRSEWDLSPLKSQLVDLDTGGKFLDLTGFTNIELKKLIDYEEPSVQDEPPTPPKNPTSKKGQIYELGKHRLMCGDSADKIDVEKLMGGAKATCVFTDPPYGVSIGAKNRMLNKFQKGERNLKDIQDDSLSPEELKKRLLPAFVNTREIVMADDCSVFVTAPQGGVLGLMMMMMMMDAGLPVRHVLIWKKNSPTFSMGRLDYDYQHEPILLTWGKKHKRPLLGQHRTSVWEVDKPRESKEHPTMKPVELYVNAYKNNSEKGDIVCDLFSGSGTAFVAAEQTDRICYGMEIDPTYCDVIIRRWENLTKKKAKRVSA